MKKLKFISLYILSAFLIFLNTTTNVFAEEIYYTNLNGATLTEEQYNNLLRVFSEDTIATMTSEAIDLLKDETELSLSSEEKFIRIDEWHDSEGNLINSTETEVSEMIATNFQQPMYPQSWNVTHTTSMKRLYMQVVSTSASLKVATITNTWLSLPSTRSYDVIAVRPETNSMTINVNSDTISGYQNWDGNVINYNISSSNTKKSSSFTGNGGIGISMNIVDSVSSSLENSMTVIFVCGNENFKVYGTYQHATSDVTLAQSQSYSFSSSGLGEVLYYSNSTIRNKYDNMQGVYLNYTSYEELYG
jgi:hypothetical protein